jgi:hypothetical protein
MAAAHIFPSIWSRSRIGAIIRRLKKQLQVAYEIRYIGAVPKQAPNGNS